MKTIDAFQGYDLDGDGFISKQELFKMFSAYFRLSMELVRDVVKNMEEVLIDSFDDEDAKPVSSNFSAPIPENDTEVDKEGLAEKKRAQLKDKKGILSVRVKKSVQYTPTTYSPQSPELKVSSYPPLREMEASMNSPTLSENRFQMIESLSHEAIEVLVERLFEKKEKLNLNDFIDIASKDTNLLAYFEALGSIF